MKTDNELNRLVAERVMGWREMPDGDFGMLWEKPDKHLDVLPHFCTDPAAWGALFVWLADGKRFTVQLSKHKVCVAKVINLKTWQIGDAEDESEIGRALVLATLAAYGVEAK